MTRDANPDVATLALLNLIRLLAAELVAGAHRHDVDKVIRAIERRLDGTPLPSDTRIDDARAGLAKARKLLAPYLKQVRVQARLVRSQAHRPALPVGRHLH